MNDELSPRLALMPRPSLPRRGRPARQAGPTSAPAAGADGVGWLLATTRRSTSRKRPDLAETLRIFGQTAIRRPRPFVSRATGPRTAPSAPCRRADDWPLPECQRRESTLLRRPRAGGQTIGRYRSAGATPRCSTGAAFGATRSNGSPPPPPSVAVEADDAQLSFSGDWITVNGLDVKNGDTGIHISGYNDNNNDEVIENCRVTNCSNEGIVAGGSNVQITGNYVDAIGGEVVDKQDGNGPNRDNLEYDLYLTGGGNLVEGNFFGRALSGSCAATMLRHHGHHRLQQ